MAIYKNREVTVVNPNKFQVPATITIQYKDGSHEVVSIGQVQFTKEEKDSLVKSNPSDFQDVSVVSDDDVKAVRLGVTPPSDPSLKEAAQRQAQNEKQREETEKRMKAAKDQAEKDLSNNPQPFQANPNQVVANNVEPQKDQK